MSTPNAPITTVEVDDIDSFLPLPGAEVIVTGESSGKAGKAATPSFFARPSDDLEFLNEQEEEAESASENEGGEGGAKAPKPINASQVLDELLAQEESDEDDQETGAGKAGRRRTDKSGLVSTVGKLIEEGTLFGFDDEKTLEDYTEKDFIDLIKLNIEEKVKEVQEKTPAEFFEALPEELQYAAKYVSDGGTDLKGLFRALGEVAEVTSLDPDNEAHQELIVRHYLAATTRFTEARIEKEIARYRDNGELAEQAADVKPELDELQKEQVQQRLQQQEQNKLRIAEQVQAFKDNVLNVLKPGEINGIKLDAKLQQKLWDDLTNTNYQSIQGKPTNKLGYLLEKHQFSKEPRYDLIAECVMLLEDPEGYKAKIRTPAVNKNVQETARKLKTEESRKNASTGTQIEETEQRAPRKIQRPTNIFKRG